MSFFDITRSISLAEEEFLDSLSSGLTPSQAYKDHWQVQILEDPSVEAPPDILASRLNIILNCFSRTEEASKSAIAELGDLFDSLELDSPPSPSSDLVVSPSEWLLRNLHNPYPSPAVKLSMELSSELQGRSVNAWFAKARRRIGWTLLLGDRFGGCRTAATDAAFRVFVREDPRSPLDPELRAAFVAVRSHAEFVFSTTPQSPQIACHTPSSSRSLSPVPSLTHSADSSDSEDEVTQPPRKRKRSCSVSSPDPLPASSRRRKLGRTPSRPLNLPITISPSPENGCSPPPRSRKRRSSESGSDDRAIKKPRGLDWAPRKQMVSDPLPLPLPSFDLASWESWYHETFTLPPSATTHPPLPDALDFELFNFGASPISSPIDSALPPETVAESPQRSNTLADSLLVLPGQLEQDSCSASWEEFFNFEPPSHSSSLPSSTNSSSPDSAWSLSPPELPYFDLLESPPYYFSSPSLFKIPTLYPTDGVEIVDNSLISP